MRYITTDVLTAKKCTVTEGSAEYNYKNSGNVNRKAQCYKPDGHGFETR
jgi:hypothetical protein